MPTITSYTTKCDLTRSHRSCPSGCSLVSRRTSKVRRMPPSHCCYPSQKGYTARRPPPQGQPPPVQPKLAMTGPTELVTCDQTIEHTIRCWKQTLHWTLPRPRTPEQADRFTWAVAAAYSQLRLARGLISDLRLPWERPLAPERLTPTRVRRRFRAVLAAVGSPASAPKSHGRSPERPQRAACVVPRRAIQPSKPLFDQPQHPTASDHRLKSEA
jgi:hypothetical protein